MAEPPSDSELRRDPITGRWVIIAPERGRRPSLPRPAPKPHDGPCPFCPGNERSTPPEIAARRAPGTRPDAPGWTTRVTPNKFPALHFAPESEGAAEETRDDLYERMNGIGAHEVVIDSPEHEVGLSELPLEHIEQVLSVYQERARALAADPRVRYVLVFKNHGATAGASQEHGHSQILATPVLPNVVEEELRGSRERFEATGRCAFCEMIATELESAERVVGEDEAFVVLAPYASRFPYETWILPRRHASSFERASVEEIRTLARALRSTLQAQSALLERPDYNFLIHSAPCREPELPWYHWHLEIVPKLAGASGFEWGTGAYINATPPEEAARRLRGLFEPAARPAS
jgi:UDPglucose--hexose-1-phosphate uridylyltransferase